MKWEKKKIKDTGKIVTGKTPPTENRDFFDGDYLFVTPSDLNFNNYYIYETNTTISELGRSKYKNQFLPPNSVMYTCIGNTIGKIALNKNECLTNQQINSIIPNSEHDFKFLYYYLISITPFIKNLGGGVATPIVNKSKFEDIDITIPPLPTQRKIASILSAYDDLIENNLKRIKLLEEKANMMYKLMQVELSDAPKINLYDFAYIQMGFAFKADAFNEEGEGIPIIRIRDIPNQMTKSYTSQEVDNQYWVEKGDLLIGMDGEFHMNEWLGQRGYLVQRVCRIRSKDPLYQSYLWQSLKEPIHYYETTISGATVAHLGKKHLEEIFIANPNNSMKNELEELNTMRKLKIVLAEQNAKLREARDILLPKLMNGQIEV